MSGNHEGLDQVFLGNAYGTFILEERTKSRRKDLDLKNAVVSSRKDPGEFLECVV
jgi:hypothetical protein